MLINSLYPETRTPARFIPRSCLLLWVSCLLLLVCSPLLGQFPSVAPGEYVDPELDPVLRSIDGLTIHDRLGKRLPVERVVRTESGERVSVGDLFASKRPVILNPVYFSCPMLCNLVVEGLIDSVAACGLKIGEDFDVITLSIDPRDSAADARNRERLLVEALEDAAVLTESDVSGAREGWKFITGQEADLKAIANAVGFEYRWNDFNKEYAHGAGIFILSPDAVLTRTIKGINYEPQTLRLALVEASAGKVGSWLDDIVLTCFVYDPSKAQYGPGALKLMRLGGILTMVGLAGFLYVLWRSGPRVGDAVISAPPPREQLPS